MQCKKSCLCVIIFFSGGVLVPKQKNALAEYKKRRDLSRSFKPKGTAPKHSKKGKSTRPIFVIQKHNASRLHYDLRLEIDGVLVSWAVPKGPSTDPKIKRLALRTDDHPLSYATFEGVIPEGSYGAGTVMAWDRGTYKNLKTKDSRSIAMNKCLADGQIEVWLYGKKLQGSYALHLFKKHKGQWLLVKMRDKEADAQRKPTSTKNKSALTGRTMYAIKKDWKASQ